MSRQFWSEAIAWTTADGTAVANTVTETAIFPVVTIPANYMADGRLIRYHASGKISTTATPTMTWNLRWGGVAGTLLATTGALTMGATVTNVNWTVDLYIQTRANGATGSLLTFGTLVVHTSATATLTAVFSVAGTSAPAAVTADLTLDKDLVLTATWGTANASNTLTGMHASLESLN